MKFLTCRKYKVLNCLVIIITICFVVLSPTFIKSGGEVFAQGTGLENTADAAGLPKPESIATVIGQIIYAILGFLGVIFIILLIYGGFLRMTAQGNPEQIKKSMGIITSAIVGVIIILASYTITAFVLGRVGASVGETGSTIQECSGYCFQTTGTSCGSSASYIGSGPAYGCEEGWACCVSSP